MLFTSTEFFVLFTVTFILYYLPSLRSVQVHILILSSLVFYAWSSPCLLLLLVFSISINSVASYRVAYANGRGQRIGWAVAGVVINLGILILFKYAGLVTKLVLRTTGIEETPIDGVVYLLLYLPLPIGISFYTFEGISLVVDTLRRERDAELGKPLPGWKVDSTFPTHVTRTAFFVAFFPHLIAGPVLKAKSFFPQIGPKCLSGIDWDVALRSLLTGYFLKVVIADNLRDYTFWLMSPFFPMLGAVDNVVLVYGYSIQIFADFAGYSLIAVGLGAMFGYELMENFNFPYISRSLAEFWGRWHISLSTWLREYLYIPLGGNRKGTLRTYLNLLIVMTLGGLWHGAAWKYAVWGLYHGAGLVIERILRLDRERAGWVTRPVWLRLGVDLTRVVGVFVFISVGWLFFKLPDFGDTMEFFATLIRNLGQPPNFGLILPVLLYSVPVILYHLPHLPTIREGGLDRIRGLFVRVWVGAQWIVYGVMLTLLILNPGTSEAFIYFQF